MAKESAPLSKEEIAKRQVFATPLNSKEELRDWVYTYLDIKLPFGVVSEESTGCVGDAIWEAYRTYKDDLYIENPGFIWTASRDGAKTLGGSILNVLLLIHFKAEIAHFAAVKKQAEKCIEYTNTFIRKITPYIEYVNRKVIGDSKSKIQILNEDGSVSFIDVIVATLAGGNSQRTSFASYDELDTLSPTGLVGYKEAKLIPTRKFGRGPLTVKYSTRKFAFGIFAQELLHIKETGEKSIQWNLIDLTEKCADERSLKPNGIKHIRYVAKELPPNLLTEKEFQELNETKRQDFKKISLYDGCLKCPLAAMCQSKLADRDPSAKTEAKSLYKTIDFTIGQFRKMAKDPEMAAAQLMCWRPSTSGLVYPRFSSENTISLLEAYEKITGSKTHHIDFESLITIFRQNGGVFYGGVDFGFSKEASLVIVCIFPNGDSILVDSVGVPGMEAHEFADFAVPYQNKYLVKKWFCDQAMPSSIKTFKKAVGVSCPKFVKDVLGGVNALRGQILTSLGHRKFFILDTKENAFIIEGMRNHHFVLDAAGNPTQQIAEDEYDDRLDALRYIAQNMFSTRGKHPTAATSKDQPDEAPLTQEQLRERVAELNRKAIEAKIKERIPSEDQILDGSREPRKKGMFWAL